MNTNFFLLGIIPLLLFVIIDTFFGVKKAALITILAGIAEVIYSLYYFGEIDQFSIITIITIILFSGCSFFFNRGIFIKIQPVIMSFIFGISLMYSYWVDSPLLLEFALKYAHMLPESNQNLIVIPHFQQLLKFSTLTMGVGILCHGMTTLIAALYLSNWWWLAVRGVGFYLFAFISIVAGRFFT
jgi:intracellular septation protein A